MDKNDIIEYVMNTPHNTNRAVLSSMLNQLADGSGGDSDLYRILVWITPQEEVQCDTSFEDIVSAHDDDGKLIIDQFGYVYSPNFVDDEYVFAAQQMRVFNGTLIVMDVTLSEQQNTVVINQYELNSQITPSIEPEPDIGEIPGN